MDLMFAGVPQPVRLVGCENLLPLMQTIIASWPCAVAEISPDTPPLIEIRHADDGRYRIGASWLEQPMIEYDDVCAVCSFIIDLVRGWIDSNPDFLCMHCGAAEFGGSLVVFPSVSRAGKSTLIARLAAGGIRAYADDLLPLTAQGEGMSLGILPRLRLPLPVKAGTRLFSFVGQNEGPSNDRYRYVRMSPQMLAPFGSLCPIGAFVLLERKIEGGARLERATRAEAMQHLVRQNFMRDGAAASIFSTLRTLIDSKPCLRLSFSDLDEAVEILSRAFGGDALDAIPGLRDDSAGHREEPDQTWIQESSRRRMRERLYRQVPDIAMESLDGESFLIAPDGNTVLHLNAIGAAIWNLLVRPFGQFEAARLIREAFPDLDGRRARRDVRRLFEAMLARGLIRRETEPRPSIPSA